MILIWVSLTEGKEKGNHKLNGSGANTSEDIYIRIGFLVKLFYARKSNS